MYRKPYAWMDGQWYTTIFDGCMKITQLDINKYTHLISYYVYSYQLKRISSRIYIYLTWNLAINRLGDILLSDLTPPQMCVCPKIGNRRLSFSFRWALEIVDYDRLKIHVYFSRHNVNMVNIHHLLLNLLYNFNDPCFIIICIIIENICSLIFKMFLLMLILKSEICIKTYYVDLYK